MNEKKHIEKNRTISEELKKMIEKEENQIEKLKLIKLTATFYWMNICGKYRDKFLEEQLREIGEKNLKKSKANYIKNRNLHIITEAYLTGGHTRLLNNWIKFDEDDIISDVVIININASSLGEWLIKNIQAKNGKIFYIEDENIIIQAQELLNVAKNYSEIILHVHPNDIVTSLALSKLDRNQQIYFVNHADHVFSLGYNYSNCVLELSSEGKKMGELKRKIKYSEVLPIPIDDIREPEKIEKRTQKKIDEKIAVSMASEYKFLPTKKYNFQSFLDQLLETNEKLVFNLIGVSEKNKIWKPLKKKYGERLNLLGILSREQTQNILKNADIYVDSFPLTSYTCILEAINLNLPVVSLKTEVADLDCLLGIKVDKISNLISKINEILDFKEKFLNTELKENVKKMHSRMAWQNKLREIRTQKYSLKNNLEEETSYFLTDYEMFFQEISEKRIFKFSYRQFLNLNIKNKIKVLIIYLKGMK